MVLEIYSTRHPVAWPGLFDIFVVSLKLLAPKQDWNHLWIICIRIKLPNSALCKYCSQI